MMKEKERKNLKPVMLKWRIIKMSQKISGLIPL